MLTLATIASSQSAKSADKLFTATQIAAALAIKRQAVQWQMRDVAQAGLNRIVAGNEASAWTVEQLPLVLRERLAATATQQGCRTIDELLSMPRQRWQPKLPMDKIADDVIQGANKLRDALRPFLPGKRHLGLTASELEARGVEEYRRIFGHRISDRHWRDLLARTIQRDNGYDDFGRLEIYLPDRLKEKEAPADMVSEALADDFADLENLLAAFVNPHNPSDAERTALWRLACDKFKSLMGDGLSYKSATLRVRQFLFARAKFMAPTRNALRMAFERKLDGWQPNDPESLADGRKDNGSRIDYPDDDIRRLRHSAFKKNGGRIDTAWRERIFET